MTNSTDERRRHERVAAVVKLLISPSGDESAGQIESTCESLDVSRSGLLIATSEPLEPGTSLKVELLLEESLRFNHNWPLIEQHFPQGIHLNATAVRSKGAEEIGYETALAFEDADVEKLTLIQKFLDEVKEA